MTGVSTGYKSSIGQKKNRAYLNYYHVEIHIKFLIQFKPPYHMRIKKSGNGMSVPIVKAMGESVGIQGVADEALKEVSKLKSAAFNIDGW